MTHPAARKAFALASTGVTIAGAAFAAMFLLIDDGIRALVYDTISSGALVAMALATRGLPTRMRPAWGITNAGLGLLWVGDVTWDVLGHVFHADPFPSVADAAYLAGYAVLGWALLRLVRLHRPTRDAASMIDAALVATGSGTVAMIAIVGPLMSTSGEGTWPLLVSSGYVWGDVLLVTMAFRVITEARRRPRAVTVLTLALLCLLAGDVIWNASMLLGGPDDVAAADLFYLAAYLVAAAAAVAARRSAAADVVRREIDDLDYPRLAGLSLALSLPSLVLLAAAVFGGHPSTLVLAVGGLLITGLSVARLALLHRKLRAQAAELARVARTDSLTTLPNRRTWDFELGRAMTRAREDGEGFAVMLLDLDRFKAYNDSLGHQAGDVLLRESAAAWRPLVPRQAMLARYGGEEFAMLLPGYDAAAAVALGDSLRAAVPRGQTLSAGVALLAEGENGQDVVARADQALYEAKRRGRDRVVLASDNAAEVELVLPPVGSELAAASH